MRDNITYVKSKQRITWVTPDYFIDCDFNVDILEAILEHFDIYWIILLPKNNARFSEKHFEEIKELEGLTIDFLYLGHRQRDPRRLFYHFQLVQKIKNVGSDVTYFNCIPDPYMVPVFWMLDKKKTIFCAHDGEVTDVFPFARLTRLAFNLSYSRVNYVNMFSKSQAQIFARHYPDAKIFTNHLALKSFGEPGKDAVKAATVKFLLFGVIYSSKNIEFLIEAACNIYEKGYRNFKVSIAGRCDNWEYYEPFMRYPEIFETTIRMIGNEEIPDLFSTSDYFVQPYSLVSQSGAMKVAFNYNLPVLASDFPGFRDEVVEGVNGYLFDISDVKNLEKLMMELLDNHQTAYPALLERMANTQQSNMRPEIAQKYLKMFDQVINYSNGKPRSIDHYARV